MAQIVIYGAGEMARLAHFYFTHDSEHQVVAFTVDKAYRQANTYLDLPLVDADQVAAHYPPGPYAMFVAMSYARMNAVRAAKYAQAKALGYRLVSYVSS